MVWRPQPVPRTPHPRRLPSRNCAIRESPYAGRCGLAGVPGGRSGWGRREEGGVRAISGARSDPPSGSHSLGEGCPTREQAPLAVWGTPIEEPPRGEVQDWQPRATLPPLLWPRLQSWEETRSLIPEKGQLEDDTDVVVKGEDSPQALWRGPNPNPSENNVFSC